MKQIHFTPQAKLANLILEYYKLLPVITRFGIPLGFGEKTVDEVCKHYHINADFFLMVCNVYTDDNYMPSKAEIRKIDIESLLTYLSNSHQYYLQERMVDIEKSIHTMVNTCTNKYYAIIASFFEEYKKEVIKHER